MKVSIVIPVYNAQEYLKECLESAVNQEYQPCEIIAVNDGSTDGSLEILQKYSDKIRIINKKNGGTASALNVGINIMSGDWFKWLSADDVLYPETISELIKEIKKTQNDKNRIYYSDYENIDSEGRNIGKFIEPNYNSLNLFDMKVVLLDHHVGNGTTSLIAKETFEKYGLFDESIGYKEDYEFWLRLCLLHDFRIHLIPKVLAKYRIHDTQLTRTKKQLHKNQSETIKQKILSQIKHQDRILYGDALKKYQSKKKSISVKGRHVLNNLMFKVLPEDTSYKILKLYRQRKIKKS